jgi:uncharacterized 2Fe-2S/4Fe-4S cluster protein (DUF4445 family)
MRGILRIKFEPYGVKGSFEEDVTVLEADKRLRLDLESLCGGRSICGKCKILVRYHEGALARALHLLDGYCILDIFDWHMEHLVYERFQIHT